MPSVRFEPTISAGERPLGPASENCAGSNYCYNNNQNTSAHQNYRNTIHKQASQDCSFTESTVGIYWPHVSKQVLNAYPGHVRDFIAGKLRARDVRPLQAEVVDLPAHVRTQRGAHAYQHAALLSATNRRKKNLFP
jgi:hypothetical protein